MSGDVPLGTRCEFCGAEYPTPPDPDPGPRAPVAPASEAGPSGDEPPARCEFCGAEYPVPATGESTAPG